MTKDSLFEAHWTLTGVVGATPIAEALYQLNRDTWETSKSACKLKVSTAKYSVALAIENDKRFTAITMTDFHDLLKVKDVQAQQSLSQAKAAIKTMESILCQS